MLQNMTAVELQKGAAGGEPTTLVSPTMYHIHTKALSMDACIFLVNCVNYTLLHIANKAPLIIL